MNKVNHDIPIKLLGAIYAVSVCLLWGFFIWTFSEGLLLFKSPHDRHLGVLLILLFVCTFAMLFLVALIGIWIYIYRDAGRRGMNPVLWVLVAIFIPYLMGIILYLALRKPLLAECPACRARFETQLLYCPFCGHQSKKKCPACNAVVDWAYQFCSSCGTALTPR